MSKSSNEDNKNIKNIKKVGIDAWMIIQQALELRYGDSGCGFLPMAFYPLDKGLPDMDEKNARRVLENFQSETGISLPERSDDSVNAFLEKVDREIELDLPTSEKMSVSGLVTKEMVLEVMRIMEECGWEDLTSIRIANGAGIPVDLCKEYLNELERDEAVGSEEIDAKTREYWVIFCDCEDVCSAYSR